MLHVKIRCKQVVTYCHIVNMTEADYRKLKKVEEQNLSDQQNKKEFDLLSLYIDHRMIVDAEQEYTEFEINKEAK